MGDFLEWLNGKKTYIGGIGAILIGIGKLMYDWYNGNVQPAETYFAWFVAGWTIISGRHAIKKVEEKL